MKDAFPRDGLYKALGPNMTSCHGGTGRWKIGVKRSVKGPLVTCENGIHLCRDKDILQWLHTSLWLARASKERVVAGDKIVVRWAVLERRTPVSDRVLRLLAADFAEHVAHHNSDPRVAAAILAARRYAFGLIDAAAWAAARDAARDAAWAAARDAARAAARDAEKEWQIARLFDYINGRVDLKALKASVQ